ncbi:MAG: hypothetical protein DI537_11395 [Stutzerimonas stutzeri]|nr:MAG: hypothetical protein DI537_11395 [Stutzerimonas stutzeri]
MGNLTSKDVAATFGVNVRTVQHWVCAGVLRPSSYTPGGHARFDENAIEELRRECHARNALSRGATPEMESSTRSGTSTSWTPRVARKSKQSGSAFVRETRTKRKIASPRSSRKVATSASTAEELLA